MQAAVGAFDVSGTGADAAQRAGFIELAAVAAHKRVVGSEGIEHFLHIELPGRASLIKRFRPTGGNNLGSPGAHCRAYRLSEFI